MGSVGRGLLDMQVTQRWSRAGEVGRNGSAFLGFSNGFQAEIKYLGAQEKLASEAMILHWTSL